MRTWVQAGESSEKGPVSVGVPRWLVVGVSPMEGQVSLECPDGFRQGSPEIVAVAGCMGKVRWGNWWAGPPHADLDLRGKRAISRLEHSCADEHGNHHEESQHGRHRRDAGAVSRESAGLVECVCFRCHRVRVLPQVGNVKFTRQASQLVRCSRPVRKNELRYSHLSM